VELPRRERVWIEPAKVRDYLLSKEHAVGRFKAAFFEGLGYSASEWTRLESDLRELAMTGDATLGRQTKYGQHYEIRGTLQGPSGKVAQLMTIWIVRSDEDAPRFITAFPGER
jgi:hypothetical protein